MLDNKTPAEKSQTLIVGALVFLAICAYIAYHLSLQQRKVVGPTVELSSSGKPVAVMGDNGKVLSPDKVEDKPMLGASASSANNIDTIAKKCIISKIDVKKQSNGGEDISFMVETTNTNPQSSLIVSVTSPYITPLSAESPIAIQGAPPLIYQAQASLQGNMATASITPPNAQYQVAARTSAAGKVVLNCDVR